MEPTLSRLTRIFFRIGNTTFGGGYVTIGMLGRELVDTRRWLTSDQFDLAFALSRITPGTNLLAFCAAIGSQLMGWAGAAMAVMAVTAPPAIISILFIYGFEAGRDNRIAAAAIGGTIAAAAGMMWSTLWTILKPHVGGSVRNLQVAVIAGGAFLASWKFGVTPVPIILAGTLLGIFWKDPGKR